MSKTMKIALISFFIAGITLAAFINPLRKTQKTHVKPRQTTQRIQPTEQDSTITLLAVGDIMMGTNFPNESYLPPYGLQLLEPMHQYIQQADIAFGNLEGSVLNSGGTPKQCSDPTKCYAFRQPEYFVDQLKTAGFDVLSVANNHLGDFGDIGRKNTCETLRKKGIHFAGQQNCPWDTLSVKGVKIGITAFAPNDGCLQITDYNLLKTIVQKLNTFCDIVIVSFHGGAEGSSRTHVTRKTEIFYDENRGNVYEFARVAIDAGADVVLGHGPHVTRAIDHYKGRFITYSMGNFCTYGRFNLKGVSGIAPLFQLKLKKDGTFIDGTVISTKQLGEGGPLIDSLGGAFGQLKQLTTEDIPELKPHFEANGYFKFQ